MAGRGARARLGAGGGAADRHRAGLELARPACGIAHRGDSHLHLAGVGWWPRRGAGSARLHVCRRRDRAGRGGATRHRLRPRRGTAARCDQRGRRVGDAGDRIAGRGRIARPRARGGGSGGPCPGIARRIARLRPQLVRRRRQGAGPLCGDRAGRSAVSARPCDGTVRGVESGQAVVGGGPRHRVLVLRLCRQPRVRFPNGWAHRAAAARKVPESRWPAR